MSTGAGQAPMKTALEILEDNLTTFVAGLDHDLATMKRIAPTFSALFAETALSVLVLEYALYKKGVLAGDDVGEALAEAREVVRRVRVRADLGPAGRA